MPIFSTKSKNQLSSCHTDLIILCNEVIKHWDCQVLEGYRGKEAQEAAFAKGASKAKFGQSKHNVKPSRAVDLVPYPINWNDTNRFYAFGGFVCGIATQLGIKIRWGGDWDSDRDLHDQKLNDLPHFELL